MRSLTRSRFVVLAGLVSLLMLLPVGRALAAPGDLDTSFSSDGFDVRNIASDDRGADVAIDHHGRIVVAGTRFFGSSPDFAVARYNPDGTLDTTFNAAGTPGVKVVTFGGSDVVTGVAVDANDNIVVVGYTNEAPDGGSTGDNN